MNGSSASNRSFGQQLEESGKKTDWDLPAVTVGVVIADVNDVVVDDVIVDVFAVAVGYGGDVGTAIDAAGAVGDGDACPTLDDGHYYLVSSFVDLNCEINLVKRKKKSTYLFNSSYQKGSNINIQQE